jgi:plasmid stability protein
MNELDAGKNIGTAIFEELKIPPRSEFYPLEPIDLGTPYVESLSGYAARLAREHFLTPSALMKRVIPLAPTFKEMPTNFSRVDASIIGSGVAASNFFKALEVLTTRRDLAWMTMVPWVYVIPRRHLIRVKRAWCPTCYTTWHDAGKKAYDPLLWAIKAVTVCPRHKTLLTTSCPHCGDQVQHLAARSQPGFCTRCKGWLGSQPWVPKSNQVLESSEEGRWQLWKAESVGNLLASAPNITTPTRDQIARSLKYCIDKYSWGSLARFAWEYKLPKSHLRSWHSRTVRPILETVLLLTYRIDASPLKFFCGDLETEAASSPRYAKGINKTSRARSARASLSLDEVREILTAAASSDEREPLMTFIRLTGWDKLTLKRRFPGLCATILTRHAEVYYKRLDEKVALPVLRAALRESPPPTLYSVAERIGCESRQLRLHFPKITAEILAHRKEHSRRPDWGFVEAYLEKVFSQEPPSSVSEISRSLRILAPQLRGKFPELIGAIACRFKEHVRIQKGIRKKKVRQEVWDAVVSLQKEGIYPSEGPVMARVKASRNKDEINIVLRMVKREMADNSNWKGEVRDHNKGASSTGS